MRSSLRQKPRFPEKRVYLDQVGGEEVQGLEMGRNFSVFQMKES